MRTITITNQKGGVGKTSTTMHLAGALARAGHRVLVVDNDSQASLTQGFLGSDAGLAIPPEQTVAAVHAGRSPLPGSILRRTPVDLIWLVPGSSSSGDYNSPRPAEAHAAAQLALDDFLGDVEGFDFCLIDCPPNLNLLTWSAMCASDGLIIPTQTEDFGVQGLSHVVACASAVRAEANPELAFLGYVLTMIDRRLASHQFFEERLDTAFGSDVFATRIPRAVAYSDAISARMPVEQFARRSPAAKAMRSLADELISRIEARVAPLEAVL